LAKRAQNEAEGAATVTAGREGSRSAAGGFIERHGLWTDAQYEAADQIRQTLDEGDIRQIRIGWGDQHGIMRGKSLTVPEFLRSLADGKDFQLVTTIFDTTNHPIVSPFAAGNFPGVPELTGLPDGILVPDPTTFRRLPWVDGAASVLSDAYFQNGKPVPYSTRGLLRGQLDELAAEGFEFVVGLEIELYIMRLLDPMLKPEDCGWPPTPPKVEGLSHGFQYLTESRTDETHELLETLSTQLTELGLPLATVEDEWGPGQVEFTFEPQEAMAAADSALLLRTAVKQICRRLGYHATFMARPAFPEFFPSGWHLHQSLREPGTSGNAFADLDGAQNLSKTGMMWLAGLLEHAVPASLFTTPTLTGYKRYRPDSFAPDRVAWGIESRGAMLRVIGEPGSPASHIENRVGDSAANPYLYIASQVACGLDGLRRGLEPPAPSLEPYAASATPLPRSLMDAVTELRQDKFFREAFGDVFVDYLLRIKDFEIGRFLQHVTDWEHQEYFEMY
jgi:glutamine synthetase